MKETNQAPSPSRYRNDLHGSLAKCLHQIFINLKITPGILNRLISHSKLLSRGRENKSQVSNDRTNLLRAAEAGYVTLNTFGKLLAVLNVIKLRIDITLVHENGKETFHHMEVNLKDTVSSMIDKKNEDDITMPYNGEDDDAKV